MTTVTYDTAEFDRLVQVGLDGGLTPHRARLAAQRRIEQQARARETKNADLQRLPITGARQRWDELIRRKVAAGVPRAKAVSLVNRENPGLREAMLAEVNGW
jgi:hypothetical protein